jgi:hypothetical protein
MKQDYSDVTNTVNNFPSFPLFLSPLSFMEPDFDHIENQESEGK